MTLLIALIACNKTVDEDGDGFPAELDCDDTNAEIFPGNTETCNEVDDNCDGQVDEAPTDGATWYLDFDGDGYAGADFTLEACAQPEGYLAEASDCDDSDAAVSPEGTEVCDGIDNDCDAVIDEDDAVDAITFYTDADGDGFGLDDDSFTACEQPEGASELPGDCDDNNAAIHPEATESCNGVDDDCDGLVDFDLAIPANFADVATAVEEAPEGAHICVSSGTYDAQNIYLYNDITFEEVAGDEVLFDAGGSWMFYDENWTGPDLGLLGIDLANISPNYGYGGLYYAGPNTTVEVRDADITGFEVGYYYAYGALLYMDDYGGDITLENVHVIDPVHDHSNSYGYIYGFLAYNYYGDLDARNVSITGGSFKGSTWGLMFYNEGGEVYLEDIEVSDNTIDAYSSMGGLIIYNYSYGNPLTIEGAVIADNDITFSYTSYGYNYGLLGYLENYGLDEINTISNVAVTGNTVTEEGYLYNYGGLVYTYYGDYLFENILFADNSFTAESWGYVYGGLEYGEYGHSEWTNVDVADNSWSGFDYVYGGLFYDEEMKDISVTNMSFVNNDYGEAEASGAIWYSDEEAPYAGEVNWAYNNVYGNSFGDVEFDFSQDGVELEGLDYLEVDPMYVGSGDYHLSSGSPLIDAGDPGIEDTDGSVSDIGAYGGPGGDW